MNNKTTFALLCALVGLLGGSALAQEYLRVDWRYSASQNPTSPEWTRFLSDMAADPTDIFEYCGNIAENPNTLPLSFPASTSPWQSTVTNVKTITDGSSLIVTYDVRLNDVQLLNLSGDAANEWLCSVVSAWLQTVANGSEARWATAATPLGVTVSQESCTTYGETTALIQQAIPNSRLGENLWYYSPWFGYFNGAFHPWIYHETIGWIYIQGTSEELYFFHPKDKIWYFTNEFLFPEARDMTIGRWVIFR